MWSALRTELDYFRWWLLGGAGLALGVAAVVTGVFLAVGEEGPPPHAAAGIRGMFMIMAPLIIGFVIHSYRGEERRVRLLMAGPLTPRELAGVTVLLPVVLFAVGIALAALMLGLEALLTGGVAVEALHITGYVGGLILAIQLMGLLGQEALAAGRQLRRGAAIAGWAGFVAAVLLLAALSSGSVILRGPKTWPLMHLANLTVAFLALAGTAALYARRNDFTS